MRDGARDLGSRTNAAVMRRSSWLFALALGCGGARAPSQPVPAPADAHTSAAPVDPCNGVVAFEDVAARTNAALEARSRERYVELAASLREPAECAGSVAAQYRRGRLLAAMGDDLLASDPAAARALFHEGFEVVATVAETLDDPAQAAEAARLQYDLLDRALYHAPNHPRPPRWHSCELSSAGECVHRAGVAPPEPHDDDELDELRAYAIFLRFVEDPERVKSVRYMQFWLLADHKDLGRELASVAAFVEQHDGDPLAAWAAVMLLDELARRVFESEEPATADLEALERWLERLPTMALWQLDAAEDLHMTTPLIHAATWWRLAIVARERGDYDECARRFLAIAEHHRNHDRKDELFERAEECRASKIESDGQD